MSTSEINLPKPFSDWHVDHTGLRVSDMEMAVSWYVLTLGFRVVETISNGGLSFTFIAVPGDDSFRLELVAGPGVTLKPSFEDLSDSLTHGGWHHVCWRVESVDETVSELKRRGVKILGEPMDIAPLGRRIAFFADPWNNVFELTQPVNGG
jgi:catechol 2,3-dioxygenase-like lactoylglutathione lyase family enzyme